jgi:hypothetical protein
LVEGGLWGEYHGRKLAGVLLDPPLHCRHVPEGLGVVGFRSPWIPVPAMLAFVPKGERASCLTIRENDNL